MRSMILETKGTVLYYSVFDEKTGSVVRAVETISFTDNQSYDLFKNIERNRKLFNKIFPNRSKKICSPSPELIDIAITNKCDFGCKYCYQDSKSGSPHGKKELVETVLKGFDHVPYQIAIGGGEPTMHPDFVEILYKAKELGTIPNYTTAGHKMTPEIFEATNKVCGGVAITYHAFKGIDWFKQHYLSLKNNLGCQINVHLIADNNVASNLNNLINLQKEVGKINLVLLAYYPDVGRANLNSLMTKTIYNKILPGVIQEAIKSGMQISFSEGLLPYFISRPSIGVDTKLSSGSEGYYSCYVDSNGYMFGNSFDTTQSNNKNVYELSSQELWNNLYHIRNCYGSKCYNCKYYYKCSVVSDFHYLICAFADHNITE